MAEPDVFRTEEMVLVYVPVIPVAVVPVSQVGVVKLEV
jgi:hypothetical protein